MARWPASSSPATLSWVRARSQRPSMARSWNRNTRNLAFEGLLRTCSCKSLRAVLGSPPRSQSSVPIPLSHACHPLGAAPAECCHTPAAAAAPSRRGSHLLVFRDVPTKGHRRIAAASLLLSAVVELH